MSEGKVPKLVVDMLDALGGIQAQIRTFEKLRNGKVRSIDAQFPKCAGIVQDVYLVASEGRLWTISWSDKGVDGVSIEIDIEETPLSEIES